MTAYPFGVGPPTPLWALSAEANAEAMERRRALAALRSTPIVAEHPKRWADVAPTELPSAARTFATAAARAGFEVEARERSDGMVVNVLVRRGPVAQLAVWRRGWTTTRVRLDDGTLVWWSGLERVLGPWTTAGVRVGRHEHVGVNEAKARWAATIEP